MYLTYFVILVCFTEASQVKKEGILPDSSRRYFTRGRTYKVVKESSSSEDDDDDTDTSSSGSNDFASESETGQDDDYENLILEPSLTAYDVKTHEDYNSECSNAAEDIIPNIPVDSNLSWKPVKCLKCGKVSPNHSASVHHRQTCHRFQKKRLANYVCTFRAVRASGIGPSLTGLDNKSLLPVKCSKCGKVTPNAKALSSHMRATCPESVIFQTSVRKAFKEGLNAKLEKMEVQQKLPKVPPWICPYCHKVYKDILYLRRHVDIHIGRKSYKCHLCDKTFSVRKYLYEHRQWHNPVVKFQCHICPSSFTVQKSLSRHIRLAHSTNEKLSCYLCGKLFAMKQHVTRHIRKVHQNIRPYTCPICSKGFKEKSHLDYHVNTHNPEGRLLNHNAAPKRKKKKPDTPAPEDNSDESSVDYMVSNLPNTRQSVGHSRYRYE
jgi:ribosomal protein S26